MENFYTLKSEAASFAEAVIALQEITGPPLHSSVYWTFRGSIESYAVDIARKIFAPEAVMVRRWYHIYP